LKNMISFTKEKLEKAVSDSKSYAEVLRKIGLCQTGNNNQTIKKYINLWKLNVGHFSTPSERAKLYLNKPPKPLEDILIRNSRYNRTNLKKRLYDSGLKKPICEMCGQDKNWHGRKISLILDHKNGIRDYNRLMNLRIVCPNCNATLDTHCGKQSKNKCAACSKQKSLKRKYCSMECYRKHGTQRLMLKTRKVERPDYKTLLAETEKLGFLAVGRKYGVSDNAIRKWIRVYQKYRE